MEPTELRAYPSWLISQVARDAQRLVFAGFGDVGARGYHFRLLAALAEYGPSSQATLGRRCRMDRSDVVAATNELAESDLVRRDPDPADRRRNIVTITDAGRQRLVRLRQVLDEVQSELLAPLNPSEKVTLAQLLGKLYDHHDRQPSGENADAPGAH